MLTALEIKAAKAAIFTSAKLGCHHDYNDDLAVAPIRTPDKQRAVAAHTGLGLHNRFLALDQQKPDQVLTVRDAGQACKNNFEIVGKYETRFLLGLKRGLSLGHEAKARIAESAAHTCVVATEAFWQ